MPTAFFTCTQMIITGSWADHLDDQVCCTTKNCILNHLDFSRLINRCVCNKVSYYKDFVTTSQTLFGLVPTAIDKCSASTLAAPFDTVKQLAITELKL